MNYTDPVSDSMNALFRQVFEASEHAALVTDSKGTIVHANQAMLKTCGYALDELQGQSCRLFKSGQTDDSVYQSLWHTLAQGENWEGDLLNRRKNGELFWQHLRITPLKIGTDITHYYASIYDLSQEQATLQRIDGAASFDSLTELPNCASFHKQLAAEVQGIAGTGHTLTMLHLDIDNLAEINRKYSMHIGDMALRIFSRALRKIIRQGDILARISETEFGLILRNCQLDEYHPEIIQRILDSISGTSLMHEINPDGLIVSMGIATLPQDGVDADSLLHAASAANAEAKKKGGSGFSFYPGTSGILNVSRKELILQLRHAIENNQLVLHYQPQISLTSGEIVGFEALVRWNHPEYGMVPPIKFIPLAEETGLILALSEWVLRTACKQMRDWKEQQLPAVRMAVNTSARQFRDHALHELVASVISEYGIDPRLLELELTESMMLHDSVKAIGVVDQLRKLGVQLSLDDFGTGYSSLTYLSQLSIHALKIDQSFVRDITSTPINASIVMATIAMAHKLGIRVIAEGVETEAQQAFLQRQGCDEMQGYLFSKPQPAEQAAEMLRYGRKSTMAYTDENTEVRQPTLLLLDDEPNILNALQRVLYNEGYRIFATSKAEEALDLLAVHRVDVIISDQRMPEMTGVEFLSKVKTLYPSIVRVVLSGYSDIRSITEAINKGAISKYFSKPWDDEELREELRQIFRTLPQKESV